MSATPHPPRLSTNDTRVLNALFDPETLPSSVAKSKDASAIDPSLPSHPSIPPLQLAQLDTHQQEIIQSVSTNPSIATLDAALEQLNHIILAWPSYASAYTNRAQVNRMKIESSLQEKQSIFSVSESIVQSLFADLSCAIQISLPPSGAPDAPVSPYTARILRTAYTHRAYLYLKAVETDTELEGRGKAELEELASRDFSAAARYGDEVAREMSVRTNPYAKMCGAIVRDALREEMEEGKAERLSSR